MPDGNVSKDFESLNIQTMYLAFALKNILQSEVDNPFFTIHGPTRSRLSLRSDAIGDCPSQLYKALREFVGENAPLFDTHDNPLPPDWQPSRMKPLELKIEQNDVWHAIQQSSNPLVQEQHRQLLDVADVARISRREKARTCPDEPNLPKHLMLSLGQRKIMGAPIGEQGPYWSIAEMKEGFSQPNTHLLHQYSLAPKGYEIMRKHPEAMTEALDLLKTWGFRRLAPFRYGGHALVFETAPDNEGRQQLAVIAPANQRRPDLPMVVPSLCEKTILPCGNSVGLKVYLTPKLELLEEGESHRDRNKELVFQMIDLCMRHNARFGDAATRNMALYRYRDKAGKEQCLPFIVDWGAAGAPPDEIEHCRTAPELAPWREACEHMRAQRLQNVASQDAVERHRSKRDAAGASTESNVAKLIDDLGLYPEEIAALYQQTAEQFLNKPNDAGFMDQLWKNAKALDRSHLHTGNSP